MFFIGELNVSILFTVEPCIGRKTVELMTMNHLPGGSDMKKLQADAAGYTEISSVGSGFGITFITRSSFVSLKFAAWVIHHSQIHGTIVGLGFSCVINVPATGLQFSEGTFAWGGAAATRFWIDPVEELVIIMMTQVIGLSSSTPNIAAPKDILHSLVYAAIVDEPSRRQTAIQNSRLWCMGVVHRCTTLFLACCFGMTSPITGPNSNSNCLCCCGCVFFCSCIRILIGISTTEQFAHPKGEMERLWYTKIVVMVITTIGVSGQTSRSVNIFPAAGISGFPMASGSVKITYWRNRSVVALFQKHFHGKQNRHSHISHIIRRRCSIAFANDRCPVSNIHDWSSMFP